MRGGASYPVGGASEIAFNIIPVIERAGGRVLVRANVTEILAAGGRVCGVRVSRSGDNHHDITAPLVVSSAGLYNTFQVRPLYLTQDDPAVTVSICRDCCPGRWPSAPTTPRSVATSSPGSAP